MKGVSYLIFLLFVGISYSTCASNSRVSSISFHRIDSFLSTNQSHIDTRKTIEEQLHIINQNKTKGNYKKVAEMYAKLNKTIDSKKNLQDFVRYNDSTGTYFLKAKDTLTAIRSQIANARKLEFTSGYPDALEIYYDCLKLCELIDDKKLMSRIFNNIGVIYTAVKDFEQSQNAFLQAIKISNSEKHYKDNIRNYINYGYLYKVFKRTDSAMLYFQKGLLLSERFDIAHGVKVCYENLATCYIANGRYHAGLDFAKKSEQLALATGRSIDLVTELFISDAYFAIGEKSMGEEYLNNAYIKAYSDNSCLKFKVESEQRMFTYFERSKNYEQALFHKNRYEELHKEEDREAMIAEIQKMKMQQLFAQKDEVIDTLIQEQQEEASYFKRNQKIIIWIAVVLIIAVLGAFIIYRYRAERSLVVSQKREAESKLEALHSKMNPHFLFNTLNSIQNRVLKSDKIEAYNVLKDFSELLRIMLRNSDKTVIRLSEEIDFLKLYLSFQKMRSTHEFEYHIEVDSKLTDKDPFIPNMMLQPHLENALIHAFQESFDGVKKINVSFQEKEKGVFCTISDNGVGREATIGNLRSKQGTLSVFSENLQKRIDYLKQLGYDNAKIKIKDLYEGSSPIGTSVEMYLPYISSIV